VKDGYYPDLTKRNSYCSCKSGEWAKYTRCETFHDSIGHDYKYDAWNATIIGQLYVEGTDTGGITNPKQFNVKLGCDGYGGTIKEGTCGPRFEVSPQGQNTKAYDRFIDNHKITCPFNGGRRLHASPSATPQRKLTAPEKKESAAAAAVVVVAAAPPKNSASFVTTIKLSTTVHKESAAGTTTSLPDRRGTVRTLTVSLLLVAVAHFLCL